MHKRLLPFLLLACISPAAVLAQVAITGVIRGVVTDSSGAVLPGVAIVVEGPAIMHSRAVTSDVAGNYLFDALPPGTYKVSFAHPGFAPEVRSGIVISAGFTASISPKLGV